MRTIVYIDGYNLYYSLLRGSPHKWLDLVALFRTQILAAQEPEATLVKLKFFTSPAKAKFAAHGRDSVTAQNEYHRALRARYGDLVEIINGFHETLAAPMLRYREPPERTDRVKVWHLEEKQTDVNLALQIYRDAVRGAADLQVICSNDSDVEPSLLLVRQDAPEVRIGLVVPLPSASEDRHPNVRLMKLSHWVRHAIRPEELAAAQLPAVVPTKRKAARRPGHW
jgi:hypothetical protein